MVNGLSPLGRSARASSVTCELAGEPSIGGRIAGPRKPVELTGLWTVRQQIADVLGAELVTRAHGQHTPRTPCSARNRSVSGLNARYATLDQKMSSAMSSGRSGKSRWMVCQRTKRHFRSSRGGLASEVGSSVLVFAVTSVFLSRPGSEVRVSAGLLVYRCRASSLPGSGLWSFFEGPTRP